jgi:hypothetical protein
MYGTARERFNVLRAEKEIVSSGTIYGTVRESLRVLRAEKEIISIIS